MSTGERSNIRIKIPFLEKIFSKGGFFMRKIFKNRITKKTIPLIILIVLIISYLSYNIFLRQDSTNNAVYALSKYGSVSDEVRLIQDKLKRWGYYTGTVDGIYGTKTLEAVKYFQTKNGLTVDGIAGPKTLAAMGITSTSSGKSGGSTASVDVYLLARLVYAEARGEPYSGQVAVAAVVLNRLRNSSFPNTLSGVIYQPGAFSVVNDGQINLTPNQTAINAAQDAINGWDPSNGALYYFNSEKDTNQWMLSRPVTVTIADYRFCK